MTDQVGGNVKIQALSPPGEPKERVERDLALMGLLSFLNLGSMLTTILGARQLLPTPMAEIVGFSIQAMLFTMLSGYAGRHAPVRKWLVVAVFASACVYCSFFTYYGELGRAGDEERQLVRAQDRHADLVQAVFADQKSTAERLRREAAALERQAEDEAKRGTTTGQTGYGPRAKEMRSRANEATLAAENQLAVVEELEPLFVFDSAGMTPKQVFDRDLAGWQAAPTEWRKDFPKPKYEDYIDESVQVEFLAPVQRVLQGDIVATVSLLLASLVDGMAILLGTAIERQDRRRRRVVGSGAHQVAGLVREVKAGLHKVREAMHAGAHERDAILIQVDDPVEFLTTFYEAINPETGHLEFDGIRRKERRMGLAARILLDRLLSRGWVEKREGGFWVAERHYDALTAWLGDQIALGRQPARFPNGEQRLPMPWSVPHRE